MSKQTIGEFLATQRRIKGYTQQQVADKLGVSNRTLSSWEQGRTYPDILILPMLAEIYGISVDDITRATLSGEPPATAEEKPESSYIDIRNAHAAHAVWLRGLCFAAPLFTALAIIGAYYSAYWAIALCAALAVLSAIVAYTVVIFFNRSALNRAGAYRVNKERGGVADKCSLAISLNTCRTLAIAGWAYLLPVVVLIVLSLSYKHTYSLCLDSINLLAYAVPFPLIAGVGVLATSVIYKNIAVKKYGDGRQNTLQRRNRKLFFICLVAVVPVLASIICVSEIRTYHYYIDIYSAPREEFIRTVQTVYIAEPMASLYGVEEGDVFLDFQSAHVGNMDYRNKDGYYHITGNLYCKGVESNGRINVYYIAEDGTYKFVLNAICYTGPGDIIEEFFDLEGNYNGAIATVGVDLVILKEELLSGSFALDEELVVGTLCYGLPISRIKPFQTVIYNNGYKVIEKDGIETLRYDVYCDYFPLVMPIACIVAAVSLAVGCTVYYIKRKRIY